MDVNEGEKEIMKLWNLHVMKRGYVLSKAFIKLQKFFGLFQGFCFLNLTLSTGVFLPASSQITR